MSRQVIDLTVATPEKKCKTRPQQVVEVLDDEVAVVGERRPPPPPRPAAAPAPPVGKRVCAFGVRCNRMSDGNHLREFAHHDIREAPLMTMAMPNLFGGPEGQRQYLLQRQRELEKEERAMVAAVAKSIREADEAAERKRVRDEQDNEYKRGLQRDKKVAATVRQQSVETLVIDETPEDKADEAVVVEETKRPRVELASEPEAGDAAVAVTFQLLDGNRVSRRFLMTDSCEQLFAFAEEKSGNVEGQLDLVQLPQGTVKREATIEQVGSKRILLYVRVKD